MNRFSALALCLVLNLPLISLADDAANTGTKDSSAATDQSENDYYWKGTQLYNLGRLGEAFDSFEKAIQKKQNAKESEAYLLQIRQEIVTNAKKRAEERATLNYGGANTPDSALNVSYIQKGYVRVTLQAKFLFDENSASLKTSSVDVLNRLAELVQAKEGNHIELVMTDELDDAPESKDIDAERALLIFAYLNLKKLTPSQT